MKLLRFLSRPVLVLLTAGSAVAQCTDYDIIVGGGTAPGQIHWELMDAFGNIVAAGDAPENTGECLPDGCYTMIMYDDGNNGWQGGTFSINYENTSVVVASGTLASGGYGSGLESQLSNDSLNSDPALSYTNGNGQQAPGYGSAWSWMRRY